MSRRLLVIACSAIYFFLMLPLLVVFPISLSSAPYMQFPPPGLSWQWYDRYFDDPKKFISEVRGPGPSIAGARWLSERRVFAAGSDTVAFEKVPDPAMPVHVHLLVESGIHIVECLNLDELAADPQPLGVALWQLAQPGKQISRVAAITNRVLDPDRAGQLLSG